MRDFLDEKVHVQMVLKWEDGKRHVFQLHGSVPAGPVRVLVSEYAGTEYYAIAALQAARKRRILTPALHGIFGVFSNDMCMQSPTANPFRALSVEKVNMVLSRESQSLSSDQKKLVHFLCEATGGCAAVDGVAGAGKTLTVAGCEIALMEASQSSSERSVHLVKTRKGRHAHLKLARKLARYPLEVLELGRRPENSALPANEDDYGVDTLASAFINERLTPFRDACSVSRQNLEQMPHDMGPTHHNWAHWKLEVERIHRSYM